VDTNTVPTTGRNEIRSTLPAATPQPMHQAGIRTRECQTACSAIQKLAAPSQVQHPVAAVAACSSSTVAGAVPEWGELAGFPYTGFPFNPPL